MLTILSSFFTPIYAQSVWYFKTTEYASAKIENGKYTWGDWEKSDMYIIMDLGNDIIKVLSKKNQKYTVYKSYGEYTDNSGGDNLKFGVIDQDGDRCEIRFRKEQNGNSQIYVDYGNCAWVYNVKRL